MKQFKIRASAAGKIMAGSIGLTPAQTATLRDLEAKLKEKGKITDKQEITRQSLIHKKENPELPQGAKTYCKTWIKEQLFSRRKEFSNKYTEKGHVMEDNSLDFIAEMLGLGMIIKNEDHFEDEHMTGTPDVILKDLIIDVKNSWDCFTFPLLEDEIPDQDYYWQAQTYMHLCDQYSFKLIYVLSDTPMHLIEREAFIWSKSQGYGDLDEDMLQTFIDKMTYPDITPEHKIKSFDIPRVEDDIEQIKIRVELCRSYISELYNTIF
jgi:hypothetical protein